MLIRKLRLERGWSQETLGQVTGLSTRTVQRVERGGNASLETLNALSAVFGIPITELAEEVSMKNEDPTTEYGQALLSWEEREAMEYARDIKGFYGHLFSFCIVNVGLVILNLTINPQYLWFFWPLLGWGLGVVMHGMTVFEMFDLFSPGWERRQIEKRLARQQARRRS